MATAKVLHPPPATTELVLTLDQPPPARAQGCAARWPRFEEKDRKSAQGCDSRGFECNGLITSVGTLRYSLHPALKDYFACLISYLGGRLLFRRSRGRLRPSGDGCGPALGAVHKTVIKGKRGSWGKTKSGAGSAALDARIAPAFRASSLSFAASPRRQ